MGGGAAAEFPVIRRRRGQAPSLTLPDDLLGAADTDADADDARARTVAGIAPGTGSAGGNVAKNNASVAALPSSDLSQIKPTNAIPLWRQELLKLRKERESQRARRSASSNSASRPFFFFFWLTRGH